MPLPELLHKQAQQQLDKFCRERVPCERFQGFRLGYSFSENHVTLFEERFNPAGEEERLHTPIARFSYSPDLNQWVLYSIDRDLRWHIYQSITPSLNLSRLIKALDDDPIGIFWG